MATTGTYAFDPDIAEIFDESFERAGIAPQAIGVSHIRSALRSLKFMLNSEWSTLGVRQWMIHSGTATLTAGQSTFSLPAGALDLLCANLKRGDTETEMFPIGRDDYRIIVDKTVRGRPDRYFVDRAAATKTVYIWPAAENGTDTIVYDCFRQMQDVGEMANTLNMPTHALDACCAGLGYRLAAKFNPDRVELLRQEYGGSEYPHKINGGALERMRQEDRDRGDLNTTAAYEPRLTWR